MKDVVIIGAGGHSRSLIPLILHNNFQILGLYDENFKDVEEIFDYELKGRLEDIESDKIIVLAVGDNKERSEYYTKFSGRVLCENLVHPTAQIEKFSDLGESNQILGKVFINSGSILGKNNLLNTALTIEHEVKMGSHNHVAVGAILLGRVEIGSYCFIGAGTVVKQGVKLGDHITIGANSFVDRDLTEPGTYVGSPVRKIK